MEQQLLGVHYGKVTAVKAQQTIAYLGGFVPDRTIDNDITISFVREKDGVKERLRVLRPKSPRGGGYEANYRLVLETEQ